MAPGEVKMRKIKRSFIDVHTKTLVTEVYKIMQEA
jgi:hypothetical protein